ncbi:UNVERIFIED_CONTAM: Heat shock protein 15 [Sesamum calycinum]|uniref:Heat shock protein 15 n=1 Tax=Sesamum calycinum TaxID=2727403 RepID=A0AAW2SY40_9LAMI
MCDQPSWFLQLHDKYHEFVKESEREQFIARLQEVEDWLYEDGEDETKGVYIAKLEELKKQGDPIEERYKEHSERGSVIDQLIYCINSYREAAMSNDPKFDHIDLAEKQKHQDSLPKHETPALLSADVRKKAEAVDRFCRPIMMKPKPAKPATPESPSAASSQGGTHNLKGRRMCTLALAKMPMQVIVQGLETKYHQLLQSLWRRTNRRVLQVLVKLVKRLSHHILCWAPLYD